MYRFYLQTKAEDPDIQSRIFCVSIGYLEYKAPNIQNHNSAICCMWVRNMVCHIKGRTQADGEGE
jgi:hypothetical protein